MDWLFRQLAETDPFYIRNVRREPIPSESGQDWLAGRRFAPIAQNLPIEVGFLASEEAVRDFVNRLSSSSEYFFTVDMIRIENEYTAAPVRAQAGFEEEEAEAEDSGGNNPFGGAFADFELDTDEEEEEPAEEEAVEVDVAPEEPAETGRILGQIAGSEALNVALQIRLLLFTVDNEDIEIPEFK